MLRIERLVGIAKLWSAVAYFHPYIATRDSIDLDAAVTQAIRQVNAATSKGDYEAAVATMLASLDDPVTHVLTNPAATGQPDAASASERQPRFHEDEDGILVVELTRYADLIDFVGDEQKINAVKKRVPSAKGIVFDLRPASQPTEAEQSYASDNVPWSDLQGSLTTRPVAMPGERRRSYVGYQSQDPSLDVGYNSGFYLQGRRKLQPDADGKDLPVVFLVNKYAYLPPLAIGLQAAGRAAIVADQAANESALVTKQIVDLPDGLRAQIRLGELIYPDGTGGFQPNVTVPAPAPGKQGKALQVALDLAKSGRFSAPLRIPLSEQAAASFDRQYADTPYPSPEYRVLAAFRIWAVIDTFYPYRDLIGEDWTQVLREFIFKMERAKSALEYNLTVAEMITHIHDSHGKADSPILQQYFGEASAPIRVRLIDAVPVITGFTDAKAARDAGLEIGDAIMAVDGKDASTRIAERLKYTAHSTPQAGQFIAVERGLTRGPKDSIAQFTVQDARGQVRKLNVPRKVVYVPAAQGDRGGDIVRVLPGNIGYTDLDRLTVPQVDDMFEKLKNCRAIIFDDRGYPNGTAWQIAPRLTDKNNVAAAIFRRQDPSAPDLPAGDIATSRSVTTFTQTLPYADKPRFHGKTVLLIDERTISQAEHTGLFFEAANHTTFIGSPTEGANGDITFLAVPGGILVRFTGQGVWHADGRQLQRVGLQPDVDVHPTLLGIRAGKDEVLDAAVAYLSKG